MNTRLTINECRTGGYALLIVMSVTAVTCLVLGSTISRTGTVANINERNNQYIANLNAAEAAVEKVFTRMSFDFQAYGMGAVQTNLTLYRNSVPTTNENAYWGRFQFSNGQGQAGKTYVNVTSTNYFGPLPSQYPGLTCIPSPIYRILSNAKAVDGDDNSTSAVQQDVLLAMVPITTYAIFYQGLLEFSTCATMVVNGRVHANNNIYVGAGGSSTLTFNGSVTSAGVVAAPANNGSSWGSSWRTTFNGTPGYKTNVPTVAISLPMTNTYALLEFPPAGENPNSGLGRERMYNKAHVLLLVSNSTVTTVIRASSSGLTPGSDPSPIVITNTHLTARTNLEFLTVTNRFVDERESSINLKTNLVVDIDIGRYRQWLGTNADIQSKFSSGSHPTILYVADNRTSSARVLPSVRLRNGTHLPVNSGLGFTVATRNPLYVYGNYNVTNSAHLHSTNTSSTVPAALMADALTILSTNWSDSRSFSGYDDAASSWYAAPNTTVNAAILTGVVKSTGTTSSTFSGGVHNLPRLLENWARGSSTDSVLWLNTSIVCLYESQRATNKFVNPGTTYRPPERRFSFDPNFFDPAKQPPGIPCALVPIRYNWAVPPANTTNYNVSL